MSRSTVCRVGVALLCVAGWGHPAGAAEPKDSLPSDADFKVQGEYTGEAHLDQGALKVGVQVVALGKGKFRAYGYHGGLPGDGWNQGERHSGEGETSGGVTTLQSTGGPKAVIKEGVLTLFTAAGVECGQLKRIERRSETLGAKPPAGAIVLFDGTSPEQFDGGRMTADGLLVQGATSKRKFQDFTLHVEFRTPGAAVADDHGRGNSGIYLQGRYELQILDSFGQDVDHGACGGIYSVRAPSLNASYPPFSWQTFDIDFTAAKYDGKKKLQNAKMTVKHNGVLVHEGVEVPGATTAAPVEEGPEPGPLYLQDHGSPVRFRNVWVVEKN